MIFVCREFNTCICKAADMVLSLSGGILGRFSCSLDTILYSAGEMTGIIMSLEQYQIPREKIIQLEHQLKTREIDTMVIIAREGSDPFLPFLIGSESIHPCAAFFCRNGHHIMIASPSDEKKYMESEIFAEVIAYGSSMWEKFVEVLDRLNPNKMALSISEEDGNADGLTLGQYKQLEKAIGKERLTKLECSSEEICAELHSVKTETEVECLRRCIQITNDIYDEVFTRVRRGMTEKQIGDLFVEGMKSRGVINGLGSAYDYPIICIVRAGVSHRSPGNTVLEHGDIVIMDFSVLSEGYISDIARTAYCLCPGETCPPPDVQHAFETAHAAISATINYIGEGKKGYEVDAVGRKVIEDGGYPTVRHSVGHPIGRSCHDSGTRLGRLKPGADNRSVERPIELNEVYAIEPTVLQDGGLPCMLVEENVVIRENGAEILSRRQNALYLISAD